MYLLQSVDFNEKKKSRTLFSLRKNKFLLIVPVKRDGSPAHLTNGNRKYL